MGLTFLQLQLTPVFVLDFVYDIKIFDSEDLIMEESTGSCDQNRHKVRYNRQCMLTYFR